MQAYYESGGVPPLPQHQRDRLTKCQGCTNVFVSAGRTLCGECQPDLKVNLLNLIKAKPDNELSIREDLARGDDLSAWQVLIIFVLVFSMLYAGI